MLEAIGSEISTANWDQVKGDDKLADKVSEVVLNILPQILNQNLEVQRIFKAFSYMATKIEEAEITEKLTLAYKHKNIEGIQTILEEIKQRPESIILVETLNGIFEEALTYNEEEIVDVMWKIFGSAFKMVEAGDALERAILNENVSRAKWLLENFEIYPWKLGELIYSAIEHEMFFVVEALIEKYGDLDSNDLKSVFERLIKADGENFLKGAQFFWPQVKREVSDYTLREALDIAKSNHNKTMIAFLNACLKK